MMSVPQIKKSPSRKLDGVFLLDKPNGLSSHSAMRRAQRLFQAEKAGHTGSLDPLATGMLPICFGEATKYSSFFLEANKAYSVKIGWGVTTTTGDSDGEKLTSCEPVSLTAKDLSQLEATFLGQQTQIPPMYSALKYQGKPLYQLARAGKTVERAPRNIVIHSLTFQNNEECQVVCSKGTYIRSLVESMGEFIGCGAHVVALRRTWVDPFQSHRMMSLNDLEQCSFDERALHLLSISELLKKFMPSLEVSSHQGQAILKGQSIDGDFDFQAADCVCLLCEGRFLGIGEITEGHLKPKRLVSSI